MKKKIDNRLDLVSKEEEILDFWQKEGVVKDYLAKNNNSNDFFSFIDGPITANNKMGVHHGWGRTIKDTVQRYQNAKGKAGRFQNGFDGQGLWVEVNVEKDLGLNSKRDIEDYGIDKFANKCRSRVEKYSQIITEQSKRLGQFMDWDNSYQTMSDNNIEHIWNFLKIAHQKKLLYLGERVLPWCRRCGTSLSSHELYDNYKDLTHEAIYLKYPLADSQAKLLVWTTTPWTLVANVAIAVDPELDYVRIKLGKTDEELILAKKQTKVLEDKFKILEKLKGKDLIGRKYLGLFDNLKAVETDHRVIGWEEVGDDEGTGLVHIAPGCGSEDFDLAKKHNLKIIDPIDEAGNYLEGFGKYSGKSIDKVKDQIFKELKEKQAYYKTEKYKHRYPLCWRCDEELVYRVVNEWFIKADPIRAEMKEEAAKVKWQPESSGKRMQDWLDNMSDWNISRKRYWGLPLPFYPCPKCGKTHVVGSLEELKRLAVDKSKVEQLPELHRPWIDEIKIKCPNCQAEVSRVTEVGDCWLDAGIVPYSTLKYNQDQSYWRKWFPADFVTEMKEQVRLWFYSMLFMSVVLESKTPYKQVLTYSPVNDEKGEEMHKSKGNAIWFDDAVEKMGADVMRWIYLSQNPAYPLRFGYNRSREIGSKFNTWWNSLYFLITYANIDNWLPEERDKKYKANNILDRWMLSRLAEFVKTSDDYYQNYQFDKLIRGFDGFLADLSNWYIRRSRDRFWQEKMDKSKKMAYQTLYLSLMISAKVMAPALPFLSELVYRNLRTDKDKKSVHLVDFPEFDYEVDSNLIEQMEEVREIVEKALSFRAKAGIKVRQPLAKLTIEKQLAEEFIAIIKDEINVKKIEVGNKFQLDTKLTKKLKEEGISRELIRQVQSLRKEADYNFDDKIMVFYQTDSKLIRKVISDYNQEIAEEVLAKGRIEETNQTNIEPDAGSDYEIEGNKVWLAVKCL